MPDAPQTTAPPATRPKPLIGDGSGRHKILIVGNCGTGKTTLARRLSKLLDIPHTSLDTLHWGPNWQAYPVDEFRAKVQERLDQTAETGWVMDGSYAPKLGNFVKDNATDIIWLDPPLILYFPRICYRTVAQILGYAEPCSPGCKETWKRAFTPGKQGILWRTWTRHTSRRQHRQAEMIREEFRGKIRRLGGWGGELEKWVKRVQEMVRAV